MKFIPFSSIFCILVIFLLSIFSLKTQAQSKEAFSWLAPVEYEKCRYFDCNETIVYQRGEVAEAYFLKTGEKKNIEINNVQDCVAGTDLYLFYKGQKQGILNGQFEVIVPPVYSTLMAAKEPGYFTASIFEADSSFLINANVQPATILGFSGTLLSKGKGFVAVGSYEFDKTKVYNLKGEFLFENEAYSLTPVGESSTYLEGNHRENEQQVIFKLDGSIHYQTSENCFGVLTDLGELLKVECSDGDFFVDKNGKAIEGEIKIPDDKLPFKRVYNCNSKNDKSIGIYFDKTGEQTDCEFTSVSSIEYEGVVTAFDENYKMTLFDLSGKVIYKGKKSEVVFPLGHDLFQVVEKAIYPVIEGKEFGVKNGKGKTIAPSKFTSDSDFSRLCKTFKINNQVYLLILQGNEIQIFNEKGKRQTKKSFTAVANDFRTYFQLINNLILIKANGKPSLMDAKGNIKLEAEDIKIIDQDSPFCIVEQDGKYKLWDLKNNKAALEGYDRMSILANRVLLIEKDGKRGVVRVQ